MSDTKQFALASPVVRKLSAVAALIRNYVIVESLLWIAIWIVVWFWLGGLLDYLPVTAGASETPRAVRIGLLVIMGLGAAWVLIVRLGRRLFTPMAQKSLALLIERKYPEFNNELVTAVELSRRKEVDVSNPAAYQAMLGRVHTSIQRRIENVEPATLLNWQPIWGLSVAFAFAVIVTIIAAVGMPNWFMLWSQRLFSLSDTPWPRRAVLNADGIQLQVPAFTGQLAAERILIPFEDNLARLPVGAAALLQVSASTKAVAVPETCTLFYRADDGSRGRANLRRVGGPDAGWQHFTLEGPPLDGLTSDLTFDVVGLDARLRDLRLQVVEPAVVADMQIECRYPSYLNDSLSSRPSVETLPYRSGMRIPQGTTVALVGKSSSALKLVQYVVRGASSGPSEESLQILTVEPKETDFRIELGPLAANLVVEVRLVDQYGLSSDQIPRYLLTMQEDTVPEVDAKLDGIGIAVTPQAVIPIVGSVKDDYGVVEVYAELARNEDDPIKLPLELTGGEALNSRIDLAQLAEANQLTLAPNMTLGLVIAARDRYDLQGQQHIGLGQPQQLAVVTQDKLLVILDRQELEMRQRLELIIGEVQQLREALQDTATSLSQGDSADLKNPARSSFVALPTSPASKELQQDGETAEQDKKNSAAQLRRIALLRAQQAVLQGDKSQQELSSITLRVDNIRKQLINNRIDSTDRQVRLEEKVHQPLTQLLEGEYEQLRSNLLSFQTAAMSDAGGVPQARNAIESTDKVLIALEAIKANMLDIESFSEIIDLVRGLLDDQERILSETEKQRKQRLLDMLK